MLRQLYNLAWLIILPAALLRLIWRARQEPGYRQHITERLGFFPPRRSTQRPIWLHCVSVGEARAAAPLIALLEKQQANSAFLFTCMTPAGRRTLAQLYPNAQIIFLPYDLPWLMQRFYTWAQPQYGIILETEIWINLLHRAKKPHIPLFLVNARLSQRSARGYAKITRLIRPALQQFHAIGTQTAADAKRLHFFSQQPISILGNMKFDCIPPIEQKNLALQWSAMIGARPILLLASSREDEEALLFRHLQPHTLPAHALLIIVPRHPQRFESIAQLAQQSGWSVAKRSQLQTQSTLSPHINCLIGDSMGELFAYYYAAHVVIMGGSLLAYGAQNLIEPCAVGRPVLLGPHTFNFTQAAQHAIQAGAALQFNQIHALVHSAIDLLQNPEQCQEMGRAGQLFSQKHQGAAQSYANWIRQNLNKPIQTI